jgi:uncharacterized protein YegP (UPF0339 family)
MGKLLRAGMLFTAIAAVMYAGGFTAIAPAQVKDKDKLDKKDKKDTKTKPDEVGVTEVFKAKDGWRYRVKDAEGKSIAIGTVYYETKEEALKIVDLVKTTLTKGKIEVREDKK